MNEQTENLPGMTGRHPAMLDMYRLVRRIARTDLPVLIVGETGTGKELVARALHHLSSGSAAAFAAFVDVNCAAIPDTLAEAEFFGAVRGAFTGAVADRPGLLEAAGGGTLFLDEVCSLSQAMQAKLLRALDAGQFRRVGACTRRTTRFRLLAAASESANALVAAGTLREDFAFRIAGVTVVLPPLRRRRSDIPLLADRFLEEANGEPRRKAFHPDATALLKGYAWPGNVRELRTLVRRLDALVEGPLIDAAAVRAQLTALPSAAAMDPTGLEAVLVSNGWDVSRTARLLGISRSQLHRRIAACGLHRTAADDRIRLAAVK